MVKSQLFGQRIGEKRFFEAMLPVPRQPVATGDGYHGYQGYPACDHVASPLQVKTRLAPLDELAPQGRLIILLEVKMHQEVFCFTKTAQGLK